MNPVNQVASRSIFGLSLNGLLCAVAWLVPFVVIYGFISPVSGQSYFFEAGACLALLWAAGGATLGKWRPAAALTPPLYLLGFNLLMLLISIIRSRDHSYSLDIALLPICFAGFCALLVLQPNRNKMLRRLGLGLCVIGPLLALYGILQFWKIDFLPWGDRFQKNRVIATIGHPNYLGSVLGPIIFVLGGYILAHPRRVWSALAPVGIAVMLFCLALARTRAIWLGLAVGFVLFILIGLYYARRHRTGSRRIVLLLCGGMAQVAAVAFALIVIVPRVSDTNLKERMASDFEIKSRMFYWDTAIQLGGEHPLLGQGYGMFNAKFWEEALRRYKQPAGEYYFDILPAITGVMPGHVHNEYIEVYCEQGWLGLGGLLAVLIFLGWFGLCGVLIEPDPARAFEALGVWIALIVTTIDAMFGFPWRLPVSLAVLAFVLARLYDLIYPQTHASGEIAQTTAIPQPTAS